MITDYVLYLADNALILGHRNSEWTGHGPILEQDIALSNIALDLIGQARNFYQYAALVLNNTNADNVRPVTEDDLAYMRDAAQFKNLLLLEQDNGDWGKTITRQFLFSTYQFYLFKRLSVVSDIQLAAIAEKSLKEISYHLRWSAEWMIRLGDGTELSRSKMQVALETLWPYTEEIFETADFEKTFFDEAAISLDEIKSSWEQKVFEVLNEATLIVPVTTTPITGGKAGKHSELLNSLLEEMQFLQRTYPGAEW